MSVTMSRRVVNYIRDSEEQIMAIVAYLGWAELIHSPCQVLWSEQKRLVRILGITDGSDRAIHEEICILPLR